MRADSTFKAVGAVGIAAKVLRDRLLSEFEPEPDDAGRAWGSGYTSDQSTVRWLEAAFDPVFGYPSIVRFSWATVARLFEKKKEVASFDRERRAPAGTCTT